MELVLLALASLVGAGVSALTGMGYALVVGPVAFAVLDPEAAILTLIVLSVGVNLLVLLGERRRPRIVWRELAPILVAAAPGTVCGVLILRALPESALQLAVAVAVIASGLLRLRGMRDGRAAPAAAGRTGSRLAVGFVTGTLTTSVGISGPPLALWLTRRGLEPGVVRDSLCSACVALSAIGALALIPVLGRAADSLDAATLAVALACVVAGHAIGGRAFRRLDAHRYEPLLMAVVFAAGAASAVVGLVAIASA